MRVSPFFPVLLISAIVLVSSTAFAQQLAMVPGTSSDRPDCPPDEPDAVQISWTAPCDTGSWLLDTQSGCRMWDWHPEPGDTAAWTGACKASLKEGRGVVQWFEHGLPIDRFEGTYSKGRREGLGRYEWNEKDRFEGTYANGLPNGYGTVRLNGETFDGEWKNGCLQKGDRVIAIGVSRDSCSGAMAPPELVAGS